MNHIEIDKETMAQFVIDMFMEYSDNVEMFIPDQVSEDDIWDGIDVSNVLTVECYPSDNRIEVRGHFTAAEVVGRIPAGPNHGYGPINPPEKIIEQAEIEFTLTCYLKNLGETHGVIEAV